MANDSCFAMFAEHHRDDGRLSLWVPVADGLQPLMIEESPNIYYCPPYVGAGGWIGILLDRIADAALESHLREARRSIIADLTGDCSRFRPAALCRPGRCSCTAFDGTMNGKPIKAAGQRLREDTSAQCAGARESSGACGPPVATVSDRPPPLAGNQSW